MTITLKAAGTYTDITDTGGVAIPGSPAAGDRMFLLATWKGYDEPVVAPAGWEEIGAVFADGTSAAGNGSGSMSVHAWFRDWQSGDTDPVLTGITGLEGGAAVILLFEKGSGDGWGCPIAEHAAWGSSSAQTVSADNPLIVPDDSVVIALAGFADNVSTITRGSNDIDVSSGVVWNGNYVESPSGHYASSVELNSAVDVGHRFVTTGGTVTLRMSATLSTAETGSVKFIVQGLGGTGGGGGVSSGNFMPWFFN